MLSSQPNAVPFEGGPYVMIMSAHGNLRQTEISTSRVVRKEFDVSARSHVFVGTVHPSSVLEVKGKNGTSLNLHQHFLVFQVKLPLDGEITLGFTVIDSKHSKVQFLFSTAVRKIVSSNSQCQIPLIDIRRDIWLNLVFDLPNLVSALFHDSYLSLHSVSASLLFKIRKVFTLKNPPPPTLLTDSDSAVPYPQESAYVSIPKECLPSIAVDFFTTIIFWEKVQYQQQNKPPIWTEIDSKSTPKRKQRSPMNVGRHVDLSPHVQPATLHDRPHRRPMPKMDEQVEKVEVPISEDIEQIEDPDIEHEAEIADKRPESEMQEMSSEELIQNQLRMSDVEFGRLSGDLVPPQSKNGTESEEDDALSELREIGKTLEMENSRLMDRTNRHDLEHTQSPPDSISSDSHHSPLLTPPRMQHSAVPDSPSPPSSNHTLADHRSPLPQTIDASHFDSHSSSPRPLSPALRTPSPSQHKSESHSHASSNHDKTDRVASTRHSPQSRNSDQNERIEMRRSSDSLGSTRGSSIMSEEERRAAPRVEEQENESEDTTRHSQDEQDEPGETDEDRQANESNVQGETEKSDEVDDQVVQSGNEASTALPLPMSLRPTHFASSTPQNGMFVTTGHSERRLGRRERTRWVGGRMEEERADEERWRKDEERKERRREQQDQFDMKRRSSHHQSKHAHKHRNRQFEEKWDEGSGLRVTLDVSAPMRREEPSEFDSRRVEWELFDGKRRREREGREERWSEEGREDGREERKRENGRRKRREDEHRETRRSEMSSRHHTTRTSHRSPPTHSDSVLLHRPHAVPRLLPESTPSPSDGWTARGGMSNTWRSHGRNDYETKTTSRRVRGGERRREGERGERDERKRRRHRDNADLDESGRQRLSASARHTHPRDDTFLSQTVGGRPDFWARGSSGWDWKEVEREKVRVAEELALVYDRQTDLFLDPRTNQLYSA